MRQLKIAVVLALAVILQSSLKAVWPPLSYVDLPLIVVVYFALQRDALQALVIGVAAGLATDALGAGGLLGAGGFSKTLVAFVIASLSTRVMLDNPLVRIPVLAGAALLDATVYVLLHRMLGQPPLARFVQTAGLKLIGTTIVGTILLFLLERMFSDRARQRRHFAFRRRVAKRSAFRLGRRRH
jgi:rod shape-determining protein MreD